MICTEFIEGFSDYVDGVLEPHCMEAARAHADGCPSCGRYEAAYRRGVQLLRSFPEMSVEDGFEPALERRLRRETSLALQRLGRRTPSAASSMTLVFGMAVVLVGAAWSPFLLHRDVQVELAPIRASAPHFRTLPVIRMPDIRMLPDRGLRSSRALATSQLWDESSALFHQYAPVLRGYQTAGSRLGLD